MGKLGKTLLVIGAACCLIGFVFFGIGIVGNGRNYLENTDLNSMGFQESNSSEKHKFSIDKTELADFDSIEVDLKSSDFHIEKSTDDNCYLKYEQETSKEKNPLSYKIKDGTLRIKESGNSGASYHVDISFLQIFSLKQKKNRDTEYNSYKNYVTLYVPKDKKLSSANLKLEDGDLTVSYLKADNAEAALSYGDFTLHSGIFSDFTASLDDGDFIVDYLSAKNANISASYGDCTFNTASLKDFKLKADDGDVKINDLNVRGDGDIDLSYGDGTFILNKAIRDKTDLDLSTGYGEIDTSNINGDKITSGDDDANSFKRTLENPAAKLTIYTSDGDITMK